MSEAFAMTRINLDIDLLRTLVAFADTGSFKETSLAVARSLSAVSMQMRRLEELIGHELFAKRGRDVALTEKGVQLVFQARQILSLHDGVVRTWRDPAAIPRVVLGIPDDYASLILPEVFEVLAGRYPSVAMEVITDTSPMLVDHLANHRLDLAVLATSIPQRTDVVLRKEPIVWVTSPRHDIHRHRPLKLAVFSDESPVYRATIAALRAVAENDAVPFEFRVSLKSKNWSVIATAAAAGLAVATMARAVVPDGLRVLGVEDGFPDLGDLYIVLRGLPEAQAHGTASLIEGILDVFRKKMRVEPDA